MDHVSFVAGFGQTLYYFAARVVSFLCRYPQAHDWRSGLVLAY